MTIFQDFVIAKVVMVQYQSLVFVQSRLMLLIQDSLSKRLINTYVTALLPNMASMISN